MRQTWMSFSCVPVAMNLPSVLQFSATWLPRQAKRRGGRVTLADAPHRDAAVMRAGDAAAVLAEVESPPPCSGAARTRASVAGLVDHQRHLADRGGDGAVAAMGRELVDPLALLVGDLGRAAVQAQCAAGGRRRRRSRSRRRRIADQRQHRAAMDRLGSALRAAASMSAGSRRTRPSPSAKRDRLAVAAEGAGGDRRVGRDERDGGSAPPAGLPRSSFRSQIAQGVTEKVSSRA